MFTNDTLKSRTALITGGGTGIGLEIATPAPRMPLPQKTRAVPTTQGQPSDK